MLDWVGSGLGWIAKVMGWVLGLGFIKCTSASFYDLTSLYKSIVTGIIIVIIINVHMSAPGIAPRTHGHRRPEESKHSAEATRAKPSR